MVNLINVGFGNLVNFEKVITIVNPDSAPAKRMIQGAKESERIVDATQGRRTKAVIIMENGQLVLSSLQPETLAGRVRTEVDRRKITDDE